MWGECGHWGTVRLSFLTIALDVAGSNVSPSFSDKDPGGRLYGRFPVRSMRRLRSRKVIGIGW